MQGVAGKTGASFGLMSLAGVAAGAAIVKFGADSVAAAKEVQQVTAQTEAVLKSTGGQANVTAGDINTLSTEIRDLSAVDDEAIQASSNLLLTFRDVHNEVGKGNAIFDRTQLAIVNMTTALNQGAIPSMEDLRGTTIQVGRALNDPIRGLTALRRVGVSFSEEQSRMITRLTESGDLMGAQKVILKELNQEFGGAARAAGDTFAGSVAEAGNKVEDLQEILGEKLLPILEDVLDVAVAVADALIKIPPFGPVFTPSEEELKAGALYKQELQETSDLWHEGMITGAQYEENLRAIAARYSDSLDPIVHMEQAERFLRVTREDGIGTTNDLTNATGKLAGEMEKAGHSGRIFSKELRESLTGELPAIVGTVVKYKEAFSLSPNEMKRIAETWAEIGKTMARDLREILNSDLTPTMKAGIAALPPEMRHAWVEGNAKQRNAIEASLRQTFSFESTISRLVNDARRGGNDVGAALADGIKLGITTRSETISIAAANMVHNAIEAAKNAARAKSPSKAMMELGHDLIEGLRLGLDDRPLIDQMQSMIRSMIENLRNALPAWEKAIKDFESHLSRLQGRMSDLRSAISGGFGGFLDISGAFEEGAPSAGVFVQEQLAGAQQFASVLRALQSRGTSAALLGEIAGAGPEAIPFAQQLLQMPPGEFRSVNKAYNDIADIAQKTARSLSESYFGDRIKDVRGDLRDIRQTLHQVEFRLERLREIEVEQKSGDLILQIDGREFARIARNEINRLAGRNATSGLRT